jgi:hypothetical protein
MAVEHFLTKRDKHGPCFAVNEKECPVLVRGFDGGYRYPEKAAEIQSTKLSPIKDVHSHIHDALQYLCSGIIVANMRLRQQSIPRPGYSWAKGL